MIDVLDLNHDLFAAGYRFRVRVEGCSDCYVRRRQQAVEVQARLVDIARPSAGGQLNKSSWNRMRFPTSRTKMLTESVVRAIKALIVSGVPQEIISRQKKVSLATVSAIKAGRIWKQVYCEDDEG